MRKIFSLLMAAVLSISTAFATTVYCKVTQSWWTQDDAAVGVHYWGGTSAGTAWPGIRMTPVTGEEGTWTYDVPADVEGLIFTRVNGSGDIAEWGAKTTNLSLPTDGKNLYTITSESAVWGDPGATGEWSVYAGGGSEEEMDTVYTWYGKRGDATATEAIEKGGTAAAYGGNSNIVVGAAQKTNWTIKLNKGFSSGTYYVGITLDKALEAGDKLQVAAFRTSASDAIFGIDFSEDAEQAATTCQILFPNNLQQISSNVAPEDTTFTVPDCAVGAKFIRIYRYSGSTGIYVANFTVLREKGGDTPEPPVAAKFYVTGDSALVTDAGFAGTAWNPAAIKAEADTLVLNLKAEQVYKLKVSLDGTWNTAKGFNELTEKPEGVTMDNDENIIFSLAEEGAVQVIYIAGETPIFKIAGNFYVEPTPEPAKFYVTGDSALVTDAGFAGEAWNPAAIKAEADTLVLNLKAEQYYKLKVTLDGTWDHVKGFNDLTEKPEGVTMDNDENIIFSLAEAGAVQVIYIAGETPIFKIAGNFYVEPTPEPVLTNGYYLVGKFSGVDAWDPVAENLFAVNPDNEAEYQLSIDLAVDDEVKVVYVENDAIVTWYPAEGGNYVIDDHHNGATTMYFRPDYQGGEDWFAGCIYVVPTSTVGFENTAVDAKAVKVLKNGILVIEKNNKTYNVMGQMVK